MLVRSDAWRTEILPPIPLQAAVRALVEDIGTPQAAVALGISNETVARIAAGLGVRRGTVLLVRKALAARMKRAAGR